MVTFSILFAAFVTMAVLFGVLDFVLPEYVLYVVFSFSCILHLFLPQSSFLWRRGKEFRFIPYFRLDRLKILAMGDRYQCSRASSLTN